MSDDPGDEFADCKICGGMMQWEDCFQCHGEGGYHDCGEYCCTCLDKESIDVNCEECDGKGGYLVCMHLPHSKAQVIAYRERQHLAGKSIITSMAELREAGGNAWDAIPNVDEYLGRME